MAKSRTNRFSMNRTVERFRTKTFLVITQYPHSLSILLSPSTSKDYYHPTKLLSSKYVFSVILYYTSRSSCVLKFLYGFFSLYLFPIRVKRYTSINGEVFYISVIRLLEFSRKIEGEPRLTKVIEIKRYTLKNNPDNV